MSARSVETLSRERPEDMFGYIIADRGALTDEQQARYKACYCGLCRTLKTRCGGLSRLNLTYDMTFLVMILTALYEPEEQSGEERCFMHPAKPHAWWADKYTDYAADMSMALSYLKCRDDWDDDCDPVKKLEAFCMRSAYDRVCAAYPRQCGVINDRIAALSAMEAEGTPDPDTASRLFGELMGEIFAPEDNYWSGTLRSMGSALGRFIYIMDAVMDLDKDVKSGSYNPLKGLPEPDGGHYKAALDMLMGECVYYFDRLPIVADSGILRNILCSGVWTAYMQKFYPPKKGSAPDDTGSV